MLSRAVCSRQAICKTCGESLPFNMNKAVIGTLPFFALGWINGFSWHVQTMLLGITLCFNYSNDNA